MEIGRASEARIPAGWRRNENGSFARRLLSDAVEVLGGADEELAVGDCGGGLAAVVQGVLGDEFVLAGGFEDGGFAFLGEEVDLAVGVDGGGGELGLEVLFPDRFAGL